MVGVVVGWSMTHSVGLHHPLLLDAARIYRCEFCVAAKREGTSAQVMELIANSIIPSMTMLQVTIMGVLILKGK